MASRIFTMVGIVASAFIDKANLAQFYDAVVRPAFKEDAPQTIKISKATKEELDKKFGVEAKFKLPALLSAILSGSATASGEVASGKSTDESSETTITLEPISTPQRQLVQLTVFYLLQHSDRLLTGGLASPLKWQADGLSEKVPRALVFLDLPKETKFIPMAAEFEKDKFVTFFDQLKTKSGQHAPTFDPGHAKEYWTWFSKNFDAAQSTAVIEKASTNNGRIEWIDFRVPMNDVVDTIHLHIEAADQYNTGTFAYRVVRRSLAHGLRLVGTLEDGPDLNVLALYEK